MVRLLLVPVILVASFLLVANTDGQDKKKKGTNVTGAVVSVDADKDSKDAGSITVKTPEKKDKDKKTVADAKEHKFTVSKDTKIVKAATEKGKDATPASFGDLAKDQIITVTHSEGKAEKISIAAPKKKKA